MKPLLSATALLSLSCAMNALATPSDCDRLATYARAVPAQAWSAGADRVLGPILRLETDAAKPTGRAAEVARSPEVQALGDPKIWTVFTERMPGTDIYRAMEVAGTLHCQSAVFLRVPRTGPPGEVAPPPGSGGLCWTQVSDFGHPFGRPAYVIHGTADETTFDSDIQIDPWTGDGWGVACRIRLRFRTAYRLTETRCREKAVCAAGSKLATPIAARFQQTPRDRQQSGRFWFGAQPPAAELQAIRGLAGRLGSTGVSEFPKFGAAEGEYDYSYSSFALFPLGLQGRTYVASIGYDGVGWRRGGPMLLAIYDRTGGRLTPLAGYVIGRSNAGLVAVDAETPSSDAEGS